MGTFGIVLLFLIKLRDMALAHMERRLMVQFTKFYLQSKNWLEKVGWVSWQVILIRKFFSSWRKNQFLTRPLYLYSGQNVNSSCDASIEKFCQKWRHSFQFCTKNREKDAIDEMRVEQALYIIAAFGVKWLFPYISIKLLNMKPTQTSFFEHQMDSKIFIRTNGHWILNIAELVIEHEYNFWAPNVLLICFFFGNRTPSFHFWLRIYKRRTVLKRSEYICNLSNKCKFCGLLKAEEKS